MGQTARFHQPVVLASLTAWSHASKPVASDRAVRRGGSETEKARIRRASREADARTRTGDPIITREATEGNEGPAKGAGGRKRPARCPHCGALLEPEDDPGDQSDVRG